MNLDVDTVQFPDGSVGELEMIRHPGASAVLPFLSEPRSADPQILLIRQYRYAADAFIYEVPAGRLEPGESPESCAHRELQEETGCTADRLQRLTTVYTTPGFTDEKIHLFMATGLTRGEARRESDEFVENIVLTLSRALMMIEQGEISDGKTCVALMFAAGFRAGL
ncbi:MAG TPA: NUDIX hydrolase [Gemmatimonadaceae bacterium]|nr:NUDIX hydrolase [Gemmatimonadaceae bacterium]